MSWEKVFVPVTSGNKLAALVFKPDSGVRCSIVVAHGFRGSKENAGRIYGFGEKVAEKGGCLVAFDFAGSGESEGDFSRVTLSGQAQDLRDVIDWVCSRVEAPCVVVGRSFGGSTALVEASGDDRVKGLVLWSTPVFVVETFSAMMPEAFEAMKRGVKVSVTDDWGEFSLEPDFAADLCNHNMVEYVQKVRNRPVLVVHGLKDEVVSPENARFLGEVLGENAEVHLVEGSDHRFTTSHEVRENLTMGWLERHFLS